MRYVLALLALFILPFAPGCGKGSSHFQIVVWGRGADAKKLDPADITDGESVKVCNQIYETLVTYSEKGADLVPCLAESWENSDKGRVWTFHLRKDVRFHDGTSFDAGDVVFTFKRHMDKDNPYRFGGAFGYSENYAEIVDVSAPDSRTAVFRLKKPSAVFLANLAMFPASIVSPEAVKKHGKDFGRNPVGTGPFYFVKWEDDVKILLHAFEGHWAGRPLLDQVIFKPVPENAARLEQLKRGEINIMDNFSFSDIELIKKDPDLVYDEVTGMNFAYLALNNDHPPFDKVEVRRAVAHAVDKRKFLKLACFGLGKPGTNPMPPTIWGFNKNVTGWAHDPGKAKKLLAEAGFPEGFETELWAMPNPRPYMPRPQEAAQIIKENLAAVGIRARIVSHPWKEYLEKTRNGEHPMCLLGWTTDNGDPDNFLWQLLSRDNAEKGSAQNVSFYRSEVVSDLLEKAKNEVDPGRREKIYLEAQERIHEDVPMIALAYLPQMIAYRKEVQGYKVHPIGHVRLDKVKIESR